MRNDKKTDRKAERLQARIDSLNNKITELEKENRSLRLDNEKLHGEINDFRDFFSKTEDAGYRYSEGIIEMKAARAEYQQATQELKKVKYKYEKELETFLRRIKK